MMLQAHDDGGLQLMVLIPVAFRQSSCPPSFSSGAEFASWQRSDDCAADTQLSLLDDSTCTEAEKLALEQLAELKKIRLLEDSQSQDLDSLMASCATERSFNTIRSCEPVSPMGSTTEFAAPDRWKSRGIPYVETSRESRYEDTLDFDFDERVKPRSRLISDLYRLGEEESFGVVERPNTKGEGKRRKLHKILKNTASAGTFE